MSTKRVADVDSSTSPQVTMDPYHVFYVNRSHLLILDPPAINVSIRSIQQNIRQLTGVLPDEQVLLINGGESLDPDKRVHDYMGYGTGTNPVYLYRRCSRHERDEMTCSQEIVELYNIIDESIDQAQRLENCGDMKSIYMTLPERARQCRDAAQRSIHMGATLIQEHQFLSQGWVALVTNMDDTIAKLKRRAVKHQNQIEKMRAQREKAAELLTNFDECLDQLKKITVPAALIARARGVRDASTIKEFSLYEWIVHNDPNHSLQDLVDECRDHLGKFNDASYGSGAVENINFLMEHSHQPQYRDIKGINKRLTQLEHSLSTSEGKKKRIDSLIVSITQTPAQIDQSSMKDRVAEHRNMMMDVYNILGDLRQMCGLFHKSKTEVLNNIRTRLNGWIVQAYEKLHSAHNNMLVFDEKLNGLRMRLDLVRQIKETPVVFATAVTEVIRRSAFQKQFRSWHKQHSDTCTTFSNEEIKIRNDFSDKMERHFLRVLFPGMFDDLPIFHVSTVPQFDDAMPPITADYLKGLRKCVKELEEYLRVTSPDVFNRLAVKDPDQPSPPTQPTLKREESFFTQEASNNIDALNKNFPSTNWLSEDAVDGSPCATLRMAGTPPSRTGSTTSMNIPVVPSLNQLSMLGEESEAAVATSLAKSAPINIPAPPTREVSEKSSQFSTPDDHFENDIQDDVSSVQQFAVDDLTTRSQQSLEFLKPIQLEIMTISKGLGDIRAEITNNQDSFKEDYEKVITIANETINKKVAEVETKYKKQLEEVNQENEELKIQLSDKNNVVISTTEELSRLRSDSEAREKEKEEELIRLREEATLFECRLKDAEGEVFKRLTIEYELQEDRRKAEANELIEGKEREIRNLRKDLEKRNEEVERLRADPHGEGFRNAVMAEIRTELEKEFKNKTELISKGLQQQRDDAMARHKKEMEVALKMEKAKMDFTMKWLAAERDQMKDFMDGCSEETAKASLLIQKDIEKKVAEQTGKQVIVYSRGIATQTENEMTTSAYPLLDHLGGGMVESQFGEMKESTFQIETSSSHMEDVSPVHSPDESEIIHGGAFNEIAIQTKIGMRSMDMMVSIQNISEGSTVLVIWDVRHNAYILFSSSPYMHFVKESSVRRLNLSTPDTPRRNWILAKVSHLDLCLIRKPTNRYRLPMDTRVYRVDVEPVVLDIRAPREIQ